MPCCQADSVSPAPVTTSIAVPVVDNSAAASGQDLGTSVTPPVLFACGVASRPAGEKQPGC